MKHWLLIPSAFLLIPLVSASTADFSAEQTVYLSESSTEVNLTGEYSRVSIYPDKLGVGDHNFTVTNLQDASSDAEITEWSPDSSRLFEFEVNVDGDMEYGFEGLDRDTDYIVFKDDERFEELNSGSEGSISFSYSEDADAVFTVEIEGEAPEIFLELDSLTVEESEPVDITCGGADIDEESLTVETPDENLGHSCNQTFDRTDTSGIYTVTYTASSSQDLTSEETVSFEVESSTSSGSSGSSPVSSPEGPTAEITEEEGKVSVQLEGFAEEVFGIEMPGGNRSVEVSVIDLEFGETNRTEASLDIEELESGVTADNFREFGSYRFTHDLESVQNTGITFEVDPELFENPDNIRVYRFSESLEMLDTEHLGVRGEKDLFRAEAEGFSVYSIGEANPSITVEVIEYPENAIPGQEITIEASVFNNGTVKGMETIDLRADGNLVDSRMIELEEGEQKTIEFRYSVTPGVSSLEIGNHSFQVSTEPEEQEDETTEEETGKEDVDEYKLISLIITTGLLVMAYMFRNELKERYRAIRGYI